MKNLRNEMVLSVVFDLSQPLSSEEAAIAGEFLALMKRAAQARNGRFFRTPAANLLANILAGEQLHVDALPDARDMMKAGLEDVEKQTLLDTLTRLHWNRIKAAKELQVSYKTLLTKIKRYKLDEEAGEESVTS